MRATRKEHAHGHPHPHPHPHPHAHPHPHPHAHAGAHVTRHAHRLPGWQRRTLYAAGGALLVTGAAWLALHYSVGAGAGELPHPLEAWSLRLHGLAAFAAIFALGLIAAAHVPQGWRLSQRRHRFGQRATGVTLCVLGALLVASGYALYYFAPDSIRPALGWAHAFVGLAMGVLTTTHRRGA